MLGKTPQEGQGESFRISEGGETAGAQKAKQRKFNTEITAEQHFPAKKQLAHLCQQQRMGQGAGAQAWVSDPREMTRVGSHEDTLRGLLQQSGYKTGPD